MWKLVLLILGGIAVVLVVLFLIGFLKLMYYSIPYDEWVEFEKEKAEMEAEKAKKKAERGKNHGRSGNR